MPIVTVQNLSLGYLGTPLLDDVSFQIDPGQRIGLLGRNGSGKTTLMQLLIGDQQPDSGNIQITAGTRLSLLQQEVPQGIHQTVREVVESGIHDEDRANYARDNQAWKADNLVDQIITRMDLDAGSQVNTMSSGMKRRVLLASALVSQPDLLLLDEPTNHLDIEAINWLESFLLKWPSSMMFVTHDRMFLKRIATRIIEIDRGHLFDWTCDYETFLKRKEQWLAAEEKQNALFDKRLAEEERWIRQGIKARRTRNEGRVRALKAMRADRQNRRERLGTSLLKIDEGKRSGSLVVDVEDLTFAYPGRPIVQGFSTRIMRGDKVGLIGPNGVGKTTFLKLLLGRLQPESGRVRLGKNLQIAYFDQLRETLDPEMTVYENVGEGYDHIQIGGNKKHVLGYLQDFLFSPDTARTKIRFLSGGERNRILLAKLFAKPANVVVLDEPTNDLDFETLEMLEEKLVNYNGTVIVVSHDREFLNNVVTSSIVFDGGTVKEYVGGYDDWIRQRPPIEELNKPKEKKVSTPERPQTTRKKLGFNQQRELQQLPDRIEQLEAQINVVHELMADPQFYQGDGNIIAEKQNELKQLEADLDSAYQRWEELEELQS